MDKSERQNIEETKDLLMLYYKITSGAMSLKKPLCKLLFTGAKDKSGENYITEIQEEIERIINRKLKKSLTFKKGIPYYMVGATEFINSVLGTEE
jgi:uncharacterized membrane-anchored protein YitT (DUF2179 family)